MPRLKATPEQLALRHRGFEMYCTSDAKGLRPGIRQIAHALGVTVPAVKNWMTRDAWQERVARMNDQISNQVQLQKQGLKALLRAGAYESVQQLRNIATDTMLPPEDRTRAAVAFLKLAKELNAIDLELGADPVPTPKFSDDIPTKKEETDPAWPSVSTTSSPSSETPAPPSTPALPDSTSDSMLPTEAEPLSTLPTVPSPSPMLSTPPES